MNEQVRVRSLDALRRVRAAIIKFEEEARACLSGVESDVQRVTSWLEMDRPMHFKREIRRQEDTVEAARKEISRKQLIRAPEPASVVLERKALRREQERLERCRERLKAVKRWAPLWHKEADMYRSTVSGLNDALYRDLPHAVMQLDRMMESIEAYWALRAPESARVSETEGGPGASAGNAGSMADALPRRPRDERLAELRGWAPEASVRRHMPVRRMPPVVWNTPPLRDSDRGELGRMGAEPPGPEDVIVLASVGASAMELFFVRIEVPKETAGERDGGRDSGWYIGNADHPDRTGGDIAVRVGDLLAQRPDFEEILRMPPGTLAVIGGGVVGTVLNREDRNIWRESPL